MTIVSNVRVSTPKCHFAAGSDIFRMLDGLQRDLLWFLWPRGQLNERSVLGTRDLTYKDITCRYSSCRLDHIKPWKLPTMST